MGGPGGQLCCKTFGALGVSDSNNVRRLQSAEQGSQDWFQRTGYMETADRSRNWRLADLHLYLVVEALDSDNLPC